MKKIVYFEDKRIIDISTRELPSGYGNRILHNAKVYVFEDGTFIKASNTIGKKFKYICSECGCESLSTTKPDQTKTDEYICPKCRGLNHNPFSGKKHTQEFKDKLSSERKGVWFVGEKNAMYGKNWKDYTTQDVIDAHNKKLSERFSGKNNPMYGKNIKDYMTEEKYNLWKQHVKENGYHSKSEDEQKIISKKISDCNHALKKSNPEYYHEIKARGGRAKMSKSSNYKKTSIENIVENWLIDNNINYEYSPIMGTNNESYQYDFIIHNKRILIEVHGDYWHGNPHFYNEDGSNGKRALNEIQKNKILKDSVKLEFALNHNFEVIYIWEEEINNGDFSKLNKLL